MLLENASLLTSDPLVYHDALPPPQSLGNDALLIHDERLLSVEPVEVGTWLTQFPLRYSVAAGEGLKDLAAFSSHVEKLLSLASPLAASRMSVIAVGGGSVGDFAGFFASVFRRGVRLVQVPSTWLAALDSAHGGKNALNVAAAKNQIGTFYFPAAIHLVRPLLAAQPAARIDEAFGELAKIAIIDSTDDKSSPPWIDAMTRSTRSHGDLLWQFLPDAVAAKYRIVRADPFEKKGLRQLLNLGHTVGHILETAHALPHGLAVAQGLRFALAWSLRRGFLSAPDHDHLCTWLEQRFALFDRLPQLSQAKLTPHRFTELLLQDKKRADEQTIHFVFVRGFGRVFTDRVDVRALVEEAVRQGYVAAP